MLYLLKYFITRVIFAGLFLLASCASQKETTHAQRTMVAPQEGTVTITKSEASVTVTKEEKGITEETLRCIICHEDRNVTHGWIADWQGSRHARKGVGCEACHVNSDADLATKEAIELGYLSANGSSCEDNRVYRKVTATKCGKCHRKEYQEFMKSRHSIGWQQIVSCGKLMALPQDTYTEKCGQCHNIQFKCDSCHTRHTFSTLEAKTPEACRTCHMGTDQPQYEMYISSKHGVIYTSSQSGILKESQSIQSLRTPVCVTCHMPLGTHNMSFGLTRGPAGTSLSYTDRNGATVDDIELAKKREDMLSVCTACHSARFARKTLMTADDIQKKSGVVIKDAQDIILGLEKDNLLFLPLGETVKIPLPGHALIQGDLQLYNGKSRMERLFIKLTQGASIAWKGAYHENPCYTYLYGWAKLQEDLSDMREEAELKRKMSR